MRPFVLLSIVFCLMTGAMSRRPTRPPFDPMTAPVIDRGAASDALDVTQLKPATLRCMFSSPHPWAPEITDESKFAEGLEPVSAAVLVPIVWTDGQAPTILLTQRTAHLHDHAGQISFPGGRVDPGDQTRADTALRETGEEVGVARECIEIIGQLPEYLTGTGYAVTPVVGLLHHPLAVQADPFEVAEVFEVPLAFLMNPASHEKRLVRWTDPHGVERTRHFYAMPYELAAHRYFIWGATAAMLRNLYHFIRAQLAGAALQ